MSYSYEATGFFIEHRGPDGQFVEGPLLPSVLSAEDKDKLENQNAGAAEVVGEAIGLARIMIASDRFGDFEQGNFKILINGHVQEFIEGEPNPRSSKSYCQIRIEAI